MDIPLSSQVAEVIGTMKPISLKEMEHVRLMRRRDTKYVVPSTVVPGLLENIQDKYRVLEIEEKRIHDYHTLYYDTPELAMYHEHHNRRLNRYKVRVRKYVDTDLTFFEIKFKNNKGETIKRRIRPENPDDLAEDRTGKFLADNSPYTYSEITPALQNHFKRITLVHIVSPERITIDIELNYSNVKGTMDIQLPGFSVIEIKRDRDANHSDIITALRREHFLPIGFSKYCIGTALMKPQVKKNLFKPRIRQLGKFEESFVHHLKH
jgi:hypothetical protein